MSIWDQFALAEPGATAAPAAANPWDQFAPATVPATPPAGSADITTNNVVRAAARGVPIIGGMLNKLNAATNATLAPMIEPFLEKSPETLDQPTWNERYAKSLALQNAGDRTFEEAHPIINTGAELTGGLASTAPLAATGLGAKLLGLGGTTLPGMIARGGASGAAIGAADMATRGGDVSSGAAVGGIVGGALPVAGRVIGSAVQGARNLLPVQAVPQNTMHIAGVDVPLSSGQATGDVATQMMEQTALHGGEGRAPQRVAEQFFKGEQAPAVEQARANIGNELAPNGNAIVSSPHDAANIVAQHVTDIVNQRQGALAAEANRLGQVHDAMRSSFGPNGSVLANSPYEAADFMSQAVANEAQNARNATNAAYDQFRQLPGSFHPATFNNIGDWIRGDLNAGARPIRIDAQRTPISNSALGDLDEIVGGIQQARDENGRILARPPVTPDLVEYARQRLNTFLGDAIQSGRSTGNWADATAMRGVMDAFDRRVSDRLRAGTFTGGDPAAVLQGMDNARGLYSQYRQRFTAQGSGDTVGPIVEKIIGKHEGQAATPEEIQNWMFGTGGTPVRVAQRLINTFGADSPEIAAARQGLFSHLTEVPPGKTWDPQAVADRIRGFLTDKGRTLSQIYFAPAERDRLMRYADALESYGQRASAPADEIDRIYGRIVGQNGNAPATTTDILNYLQGATGQGNRGISAKLAQRLQQTMSPSEWNALRQSQWESLTTPVDGKMDWGPQKISQRIFDFVNGPGKPLADVYYSPGEQQRMIEFANLQKQLVPKPGTVNYSNTAPVLSMLVKNAAKSIPIMLGAEVAGPVGALAGVGVNAAGKALGERSAAGRVARSLYGDQTPIQASNEALRRAAAIATVIGRGSQPALMDQSSR